MTTIAVLHPGEMGTAIGRALRTAGHTVGWLRAGRSRQTVERARAAGFVELDSLDGVGVVVSLCPPDAALPVARESSGFPGVFVDANATSPATSRQLATLMPTFVDGSVIGPPPTSAGTTRLYLAGKAAPEVAALFAGTVVDTRVLSGATAASSLKMAYAAWTKIGAALLLSAHDLAERSGVADALDAEWALSQLGLAERLAAARGSAGTKGWRWTGEMREIAAALADAELPAGFGAAAAEVFGRYPRPE